MTGAERGALRELRSLGRGRLTQDDRERLAALLHGHVCAFLRARRARSRFGFPDPFADVVQQVADWEVAFLLQERAGANGDPPSCRLGRWVESLEPRIRDDDEALLGALKSALWRRADRGITRCWKQHHPEEARWLRGAKRALRGRSDLKVLRDPRGQLVVSASSRLSRPPMDPDRLAAILPGGAPSPARAISALSASLAPGADHGGYCYLLDLVRCARRRSADLLDRHPEGTGAQPARESWRVAADGFPEEMWIERVRDLLARQAIQILRKDAARAAERREDADAVRDAYVRICVEMVGRGFGIGRAEWAGLAQRDLVARLLPCAAGGDASLHRDRLNYLIRRVRGLWGRGAARRAARP